MNHVNSEIIVSEELTLLISLLIEALERLKQRIQQLEQDLAEAFAFADQANYEKHYMESVLRQYGIDPWVLPNTEVM